MSTTKVFRFKFSDAILEEMKEFARIHKFDDRNDFKEAWKAWTENNSNIISIENKRLTDIGFTGDINDKMYNSVRFYYSKKSYAKPEPKKRRKYISIDKSILCDIDRHITNSIESGQDFKPSDGFQQFIELNGETVMESLAKTGLNKEDINTKLKRFKNRYFLISNKDL